jgi:ABC-type transport system involved in multi-copper enzyme maturation permease subunit
MTVLPVIERELRAEARNSYHHWLRLTSATAVLAYFFLIAWDFGGPVPWLGQRLFQALAESSVLMTLVVTPLLTADCLSREKREGTLGLLFLTPLTPLEIVVGKSLVHLLRAMTVLAALAPFFAVPMMLGGVPLGEGLVAFLANVAAALIGLGAGLIASARNLEWARAVVWAELLTAGFACGFVLFLLGLDSVAMTHPFLGTIILCCAGLAGGWMVIAHVASALKESWQRDIVDPPQPRWTRNFSNSQFWRQVFRWDTARTLDRNPIAWLQEYSWTARLTKWGWLLVAIVGEVFGPRNVMWALTGAIAFASAASFRREQEAGSLELLLVTPLREWQLIKGRLWGLFCHFLPAVLVWTVFRYMQSVLQPRSGIFLADVLALYFSFLTLPLLGFCLSFTRLNSIGAFLLCLVGGVVLPQWLGGVLTAYVRLVAARRVWNELIWSSLFQIGLAAISAVYLYTLLAQRRFLSKPST